MESQKLGCSVQIFITWQDFLVITCHKRMLEILFVLLPVTVRKQITLLRRTPDLLPNPIALVSVSKGMWAVNLCTNKILLFSTGGAG